MPDARSAILRFFHIGAVTIERVETLPAARDRPLTAGLGPALSLHEAETRSGVSLVLNGPRPQRFYAQPGLIATLLHYRGKPVLLAELQGDQTGIVKKLAGPETRVEPAPIGSFGLWLEGGRHVLIWETGSGEVRQIEPRLAGKRPDLDRRRPHLPSRGRLEQGPDVGARASDHPIRGEPQRRFVRIEKR